MSARNTDAVSLRTADGRVPGRRGLATRRKLLNATAAMLRQSSYRDLTVVDIARAAGTSPATFYQYFDSVEGAIGHLAEEMAEEGAVLAEPVAGAWRGKDSYATAQAVVARFLSFWDDHQALLRLVDLHIAEGDHHQREIRTHMLNPVTVALREVIAAEQADGRHPPEVDPAAQAAALVSMLAHVAEHRGGLEAWGVRTEAARESLARILFWGVTGRSPR